MGDPPRQYPVLRDTQPKVWRAHETPGAVIGEAGPLDLKTRLEGGAA